MSRHKKRWARARAVALDAPDFAALQTAFCRVGVRVLYGLPTDR